MSYLVFCLAVFVGLGVFFLFIHLMMGKVIRPAKPETEKLTIYECGEPTVGSAWIQFDLRYYVVALLFVVFDVEVAFFFPWAVVFGGTSNLAQTTLSDENREVLSRQLVTQAIPPLPGQAVEPVIAAEVARSWAYVSLVDLLVFFGVLMVGFAYLWRRGDIDWVRSTASETPAAPPEEMSVRIHEQAEGKEKVLVAG